MREIKFRVWFCDQMAYNIPKILLHRGKVKEIYINWDEDDDCNNPADTWTGHNDYVLMQYTGLKDKNGKEIYEGDILGCVSGDDFRRSYYKAIITVVYNPKKARFEWDKSAKYSHKDLPDILRHEYAVIGNIYENQELLNDTK